MSKAYDMSKSMVKNNDLIWNLGEKRYQERSVGFLKRFENTLCLFSGSVRQLYSNYEIHPVAANDNKAIALPNPYAYHDTFNHVPDSAVVPTGVFITPSEAANDDGRRSLSLVYRSRKTGTYKTVPLEEGLRRIQRRFEGREPFLPVIVNSDLKFRNNNQPLMHLHRINLGQLDNLSQFQKHDMARSIQTKMGSLLSQPCPTSVNADSKQTSTSNTGATV